jgi:CheY-like chemotaxis protein
MKQKVLVVEDEQDTADLLKHVLEREGFSVLQVKDGRQATALVGTVRPPSLVLLDLVIPYVSGPEVLRMIREDPDWKQVPIIILSADSYEPDIRRALSEGATAYVTKQKGSLGLLAAVKQTLSLGPTPRRPARKVPSTPTRKRRTSVDRQLGGRLRKKRAD